jgi:bacterioferritin-associated ferredoxin
MIVCICQGVSDRVVRLAVLGGATTVDAVAARCGAGTDCGTCRYAIQDLLDDGSGSGSCNSAASGHTTASSSVAAGAGRR